MESKVQKQEQQMLVYWEQSAGGVQMENYDMEEENEDCEMYNPQMQSIEDEKTNGRFCGQHNIDFQSTND